MKCLSTWLPRWPKQKFKGDFPDCHARRFKSLHCLCCWPRASVYDRSLIRMKLLFDENLSPKLPNSLSDIFPNSLHVRDVGMKATIDPVVWDYAKDNNLMIVSKDADMHDLSLVFGNPPKVIWLRLGNCSTLQVVNSSGNVEVTGDIIVGGADCLDMTRYPLDRL